MSSPLLKTLGFTAGSLGAGAGLHAAGLGDLLAPLDWPRQAVTNLVAAPYRALQKGDLSELAGAVPGALGVLGATLVGGPLGLAAGAALGGLAQGAGNATGAEAFNAPTPHDLASPLVRAAGFDPEGPAGFAGDLAAGILTDPLTYLGGAGAAAAAGKLGKASGAAEEASGLAKALGAAPGDLNALPPPPVLREGLPALPAPTPPFYSRLGKALETLPPEAKAESVLNLLRKAPEGVSGEELGLSGIPELAAQSKGQRVPKEDLLKAFDENKIQVQESFRGEAPRHATASPDPGYDIFDPTTGRTVGWKPDLLSASEYAGQHGLEAGEAAAGAGGPSKWPQYQTPGGQNYRELLLTLPEKAQGNYKSSHWNEPNVLAHVRFNERVGPSGERVLHVEEVQSDWHQAGAKEGYYNPEDLQNAGPRTEVTGKGGRVPEGPFKDTWHELAMKRMIRYAAENGFDRLSWNEGSQLVKLLGGKESGQTQFYDKTLPNWLNKYAKKWGVRVEPIDLKIPEKPATLVEPERVQAPADLISRVGGRLQEAGAKRSALETEYEGVDKAIQERRAGGGAAGLDPAVVEALKGYHLPGTYLESLNAAVTRHPGTEYFDTYVNGLSRFGVPRELIEQIAAPGRTAGEHLTGLEARRSELLRLLETQTVGHADPDKAIRSLLRMQQGDANAMITSPTARVLGPDLVNEALATAGIYTPPPPRPVMRSHSLPISDALRRAVLGKGQPLLAVPAAGALAAALSGGDRT